MSIEFGKSQRTCLEWPNSFLALKKPSNNIIDLLGSSTEFDESLNIHTISSNDEAVSSCVVFYKDLGPNAFDVLKKKLGGYIDDLSGQVDELMKKFEEGPENFQINQMRFHFNAVNESLEDGDDQLMVVITKIDRLHIDSISNEVN